MNNMIAACGLDCEACQARIATVNHDTALREKVAAEWSVLNGAEITPDMINCCGCRTGGAKSVFCESLCLIRPCAAARGFATCGSCPEMETCEKLAPILTSTPEVRPNLLRASGE